MAFVGSTALMKAAYNMNEELTQILITNGANVNATNDVGDSAMNMAASKSKNEFQSMNV